VGQYRTMRNKLKPVYSTDKDGESVRRVIGRNLQSLDKFNETREDLTPKRKQMLQRHPTKGDRPMSVKRARAQATIAAIRAGQEGAADLRTMGNFIRNG
jgi:hypothetical protein